MKIKAIKKVGRQEVYDLSVNEAEHYVLKNGIVTHNTGIYYSANAIWIIGRQQDKVGTEVQGYHFVINIEKSRFVKEKSKIPISVSWTGGIEKWSGLLEIAVEGGYVIKPSNGWYVAIDPKTKAELSGKLREKDTYTESFWEKMVFAKTDFAQYITDRFTISQGDMVHTIEDTTQEEYIDEEEV